MVGINAPNIVTSITQALLHRADVTKLRGLIKGANQQRFVACMYALFLDRGVFKRFSRSVTFTNFNVEHRVAVKKGRVILCALGEGA